MFGNSMQSSHTSTLILLLRPSTLSRNNFLLKVYLINFSSSLVNTLILKKVEKRRYPLEFYSMGLLELERPPSLKNWQNLWVFIRYRMDYHLHSSGKDSLEGLRPQYKGTFPEHLNHLTLFVLSLSTK